MKFDRFRFMNAWDWIYIMPSIALIWNEQIYYKENFSINLHWLGFHFQWRWLKGESK